MANPEHVKVVKQGLDSIAKWRKQNPRKRLDLSEANFKGMNLSGMNLSGANLKGTNLKSALFLDTKLRRANLEKANLINACFDSADMWGINLVESTLEGADLDSAFLVYAKLHNANLIQARMIETDLREADLSGANLDSAEIEFADLGGAKLFQTSLAHARIASTNFTNADFSNAYFSGTILGDCDISQAIGLDLAVHEGPSTIGIDTILLSEGNIPVAFLRGCGLPDDIIEYVTSLSRKPIQYYKCFISHSSSDAEFAKYLFDKLQGANVRCWYFPESAKTGEKLWEEINKAIRLYDKLVIVCSHHSLESKPVLREIEEGLKREQSEAIRKLRDEERVVKGEMTMEEFKKKRYHLKVLFPITIDDYIFDGWQHPLSHELRETRVIGDIRQWKDYNSFDRVLKKLLKDLKAGE